MVLDPPEGCYFLSSASLGALEEGEGQKPSGIAEFLWLSG